MAKELSACVACDGSGLDLILDLGIKPLANGFHKVTDPAPPEFPLALRKCRDCHHCQLSQRGWIPRFCLRNTCMSRGHRSRRRATLPMWRHASTPALMTRNKNTTKKKKRRKTVLDLACNDGSQLDAFRELGWETFGVDPAENLVPLGRRRAIRSCAISGTTRPHSKSVNLLPWGKTIKNLPWSWRKTWCLTRRTLQVSWRAIALVCDEHSDVYIQTSQKEMLFNGEFARCITSTLASSPSVPCRFWGKRCGFELVGVEKVALHGGSIVFHLKKKTWDEPKATEEKGATTKRGIEGALEEELEKGLAKPEHRGLRFAEIAHSSMANRRNTARVGRASQESRRHRFRAQSSQGDDRIVRVQRVLGLYC